MVGTTERYVAAIAEQSTKLASAANGAFNLAVEHCPGWTVEDLVAHLVEVHWFWATIVDEQLAAPPTSGRPERPDADQLIDRFVAGAARLADVLARADQSASVYTWAPSRHDVAFVTRHQVQEVAVHHWDVANAVGRVARLDPELAADAVDEFLTFSLSSDVDPADPPRPPLAGALSLVASDAERAWTVRDSRPGTVRVDDGDHGTATVAAPAFELLLWLYGRVAIDVAPPADELGRRLRALTFTD